MDLPGSEQGNPRNQRIGNLGLDGKRDGRGRSPESPHPHGSLRWGQVNIEDDLWSWRGPLQVSAHPNPQLVDVGVLSIVGRDRQRVRDGQELGEAGKRVRSLSVVQRQCSWLDCQEPATAALRKTARHQHPSS